MNLQVLLAIAELAAMKVSHILMCLANGHIEPQDPEDPEEPPLELVLPMNFNWDYITLFYERILSLWLEDATLAVGPELGRGFVGRDFMGMWQFIMEVELRIQRLASDIAENAPLLDDVKFTVDLNLAIMNFSARRHLENMVAFYGLN